MKKIRLLTILFLLPLLTTAQDITVVDNFSKFPMPGVSVYCVSYPDTLQTNSDGVVNIDFLPNDEIIIFSFPMFKKEGLTKAELFNNGNVVFIDRSASLMQQNTSLLATKEFSADLPFFTDIVNLDDASIFDIAETSTGNDNITMRANEGGFSVFQGLEANKILFTIDGIRLNDEIHKNGKVEGLLNFNNSMTQTVRKVYGTGYTFYSPHSIGGVVNYYTKMSPVSSDYAFRAKFELNSKYQSASNSFINNANISLTSSKFTSFTSLSYGNFGQVKMGQNRQNLNSEDSIYGLNLYYVEHTSNGDTIKENPNPHIQLGTNYSQVYFLQKFRYRIDDFANILLNFHYVNTSKVGIYSGLTEINIDHLRFAECQFGPQEKYIGNISFVYDRKTRFIDLMVTNLSYISYNEYRLTRKFQNPVALHQKEYLSVIKYTTDFVKIKNTSRYSFGLAYDYNNLKTNAYFENIDTDTIWQGLTRYPTHGSFSHNGAAYFNFKSMSNSKIYFNLAARIDYRYSFASFENTSPQLPLSFTEIKRLEFAPVASANTEAMPFSWLYMNLVVSASRQLPIMSDFARIMVKDFIANIPTDNLKPEKNYSSKFGITFFISDDLKIYGSSFFTYAFDAIISKDTTLNGNDSLNFGTDGYDIATKVNIPQAYIYGGSVGFSYKQGFNFSDKFTLKLNASVNYVKGINVSNELPLPNINPLFGNVSLLASWSNLELKFSNAFNGSKPIEELSPVGEDYIEKAATSGFLPWKIYNFKLSYKYKDTFQISAGVDNIFDVFYRPYKTAIAAPGRNFVFSTKIVIN